MAPRTRIRAQFSTFWDGNSLQDGGSEAKPVFGCIISQLERRIWKEREDIFELAEFMAFLTASYCLNLSLLKSMFSNSI